MTTIITDTEIFTTMPEVHAASGDATPVYGRSATDGKTVAAWNVVDDSAAGDLFHFTTGPNKAQNANGAVYLGNRAAGDRTLNGYMQRFALSLTKGVFDGATSP